MTRINRSAGYCSHCQRGVTIVKPTGNRLFDRIRFAITNNEESWVCSKCASPATKGFNPPTKTTTAAPHDPEFSESLSQVKTETLAVAPPPAKNSGVEAICYMCQHNIPFPPDKRNTMIICPGCREGVLIPGSGSTSRLTLPAPVIKLDDDPDRPEISKSLCTHCRFEMTYPKRLMGKEVGCPSCLTQFQLP